VVYVVVYRDVVSGNTSLWLVAPPALENYFFPCMLRVVSLSG
jgi:hypothetical protein